VSQVIVESLEDWNMKFPAPKMDVSRIRIK